MITFLVVSITLVILGVLDAFGVFKDRIRSFRVRCEVLTAAVAASVVFLLAVLHPASKVYMYLGLSSILAWSIIMSLTSKKVPTSERAAERSRCVRLGV
jgi:hypothetical protein